MDETTTTTISTTNRGPDRETSQRTDLGAHHANYCLSDQLRPLRTPTRPPDSRTALVRARHFARQSRPQWPVYHHVQPSDTFPIFEDFFSQPTTPIISNAPMPAQHSPAGQLCGTRMPMPCCAPNLGRAQKAQSSPFRVNTRQHSSPLSTLNASQSSRRNMVPMVPPPPAPRPSRGRRPPTRWKRSSPSCRASRRSRKKLSRSPASNFVPRGGRRADAPVPGARTVAIRPGPSGTLPQ